MNKTIVALALSVLVGIMIFGMIGMVKAVNTNISCENDDDCGIVDKERITDCCGSCVQEDYASDDFIGINKNWLARERNCSIPLICPACVTTLPLNVDKYEAKCINSECIKKEIVSDCKNLYWIDNTNKNCEQKQFCGMFMYYGLQTFESKTLCEKAVNESKNKNNTFVPYQKQNITCEDGCKCVGAVKSCETENGKIMIITAGNSGKIITLEVDKIKANVSVDLEQATENNKTKLKTTSSDGIKSEIKIMPNTASATAIAKLGDLGFTIELKEVGKETTDTKDDKVVYELTGNKEGKFLGIFKIIAKVQAQVDAETGDVKVIKPWWGFLATGI